MYTKVYYVYIRALVIPPYTNTMELEFYRKQVYGNELMYLADKAEAKEMSTLTGRTTINASDMRSLQALGFTFKEVLAPKAD